MAPHKANDWIIKGESFIRDFDGMYRNVTDPWDQENKIHNDQSFKFLLQYLQLLELRDKDLLDLGCGPGHCAALLQGFTKCRYYGADISPAAIEKARAKNIPSTTFYVYDVTQGRIKMTFNTIVACKTVYYWGEKLNAALSSIQSMLSPSGYFAYTYNYTQDSFSNRYFTSTKLRSILCEAFSPIVVSDYYDNNECVAIDLWQLKT